MSLTADGTTDDRTDMASGGNWQATGEAALGLSLLCDPTVLFASIRQRCGARQRRERGVGSADRCRLDIAASGGSMGSLAFVELEMAAAGIVNYATDLDSANFADIARAIGLHGVRRDELETAPRDAPVHAGPAVSDIVTARHKLSRPPKLTFEQIKGLTLYASRTILFGRPDEIVELDKTTLRHLGVE
jgi:hypothetical protein